MTPFIRITTTFAICAGALAGTYLLDTNPYWAALFYIGCISLWWALNADDRQEDKP